MNAQYLRKNQETLTEAEKQELIDIATKFNLNYSEYVSLDGFSEACHNDNTIAELVEALENSDCESDMDNWGIDKSEWTSEIKKCLVSMIRVGLNMD